MPLLHQKRDLVQQEIHIIPVSDPEGHPILFFGGKLYRRGHQGLFSFSVSSNGGNNRRSHEHGQPCRVNGNPPAGRHIHHVQGDADGKTHFQKLDGEIKVSLQVGRVHDIDDNRRFFIDQKIAGNHLFQ